MRLNIYRRKPGVGSGKEKDSSAGEKIVLFNATGSHDRAYTDQPQQQQQKPVTGKVLKSYIGPKL